MGRRLLDKKELVEALGNTLSFDSLGRLTRSGKIPCVRFPGIRRYFYDYDAVLRWIDNLQAQSIQPEPGKLRAVK